MTASGLTSGQRAPGPYTILAGLIEQAIARGDDPDRTCHRLGITPADIDAVQRRMDKAASETDEPEPTVEYDDTPFNPYCGNHAAYNRHKARDEPIDAYCRNAEKAYQRARYARKRERKAS